MVFKSRRMALSLSLCFDSYYEASHTKALFPLLQVYHTMLLGSGYGEVKDKYGMQIYAPGSNSQ